MVYFAAAHPGLSMRGAAASEMVLAIHAGHRSSNIKPLGCSRIKRSPDQSIVRGQGGHGILMT